MIAIGDLVILSDPQYKFLYEQVAVCAGGEERGVNPYHVLTGVLAGKICWHEPKFIKKLPTIRDFLC